MRLIGLTGGIATGKSTVAGMLAARGASIIDADLLAREVVLPGTPGFKEIVACFGTGVLDPSGRVDRTALGALVFADPPRRAELEGITHPRIHALMEERVLEAIQGTAPLVVADIPLLFERSREGDFEGVMLVYAPVRQQLSRLSERDGLDQVAAQRRIEAQLPIEVKRARATWLIDNSAAVESTAAQVATWWQAVVAPR